MKLPMLAISGGGLAVIILVAVFGVIVFGVIMLKRHTKFFKDKEPKKPEEKQIVQEELHRVLEEVDDEETKKAMADFEKNKPQNEEHKEENK